MTAEVQMWILGRFTERFLSVADVADAQQQQGNKQDSADG